MRLIDADALAPKLEGKFNQDMARYALTIDAVPVVRCKDCKHYEIHKPKVLENCERNGYLIPMKHDDFCSYGERRSDA